MTQNSEKVVFLVDPDIAVRDSVRSMLESYGVQVRTYSSGRSFLTNAQINGHDCVLVENSLPDMSGVDILEHLKHKGIDALFILLSSANDAGFEEMVATYNIRAIMLKPIHGEHLLQIIDVL